MTYTVKFTTYAGNQTISMADDEADGLEDAIVKATLGLINLTGVSLPQDAGFLSVERSDDDAPVGLNLVH